MKDWERKGLGAQTMLLFFILKYNLVVVLPNSKSIFIHFLSSARQQWNLMFAQHLPSLSNEDKQKRTSHSSSYFLVRRGVKKAQHDIMECNRILGSFESESQRKELVGKTQSNAFVKNLNNSALFVNIVLVCFEDISVVKT
ncbi:hypothetical protein GQX74_014505 [Glossina fuscipes]|nr:hypothetical protein GQX74_014505 [Glossina fuscipes]